MLQQTLTPKTDRAAAPRSADAAHEAYSFACLRCGYGWERSYVIQHHGWGPLSREVTYTVDGKRVPSPLTNPSCPSCESDVVRIMRAGRVAGAQSARATVRLHAPWQENLLATLFPQPEARER
ncbi:hypothetical protein ABT160_05830 [Streptomyces sp. NPDC001941]|uniref:hypothetical protein n=1 Tax=Streptomyces sp. NPDC001941 TaxID=3154659 RepID=UPI0033343C35